MMFLVIFILSSVVYGGILLFHTNSNSPSPVVVFAIGLGGLIGFLIWCICFVVKNNKKAR